MTRILQDENQPLKTIYDPIQSGLMVQVDDYKNKLKKAVNARDFQKQNFKVKQKEIWFKNEIILALEQVKEQFVMSQK